jgi:hypothetical protein
MHVSRMMADVGGIVKVRGRRIATPLAPPRPGRTPMMVPSRMPTTAIKRLYGVSAIWKPRKRFSIPTRQYPSQVSTGPLGMGTRNQVSKMKNVTTGIAVASAKTVRQ